MHHAAMLGQYFGFGESGEWQIQGAASWMRGNVELAGWQASQASWSPVCLRLLWFIRPEQHPFCLWGTVKAGFLNQFDTSKSNMIEQRQEILSWYCPAFSLEPTIHPVFQAL